MSDPRFHVGSDVGGTFTDLWVRAGDGRTETVFKSPTTADVIGGVVAALRWPRRRTGLSSEEFCAGIERFGHGTTVGLNALLTGRTAKTAILTNEGFADTLEIGRVAAPVHRAERDRGQRLLPAQPRARRSVPRRRVVEVRRAGRRRNGG